MADPAADIPAVHLQLSFTRPAQSYTANAAGAPASGGYMLNAGDAGMLRSLDTLPATAASTLTPTGSSIAAHVDHVRYGLSLMNRWSAGDNPFKDADWSASWRNTTVNDEEWRRLRADLRSETSHWLHVLDTAREVRDIALSRGV